MMRAMKKEALSKTRQAKTHQKKTTPAKMMQAIEISDGKLVSVQRPIPEPAAGEVLIRVMAAGINRPDILQRKGLYPAPVGITDIPGLEVAGVIAKTGKGVRGLKKGQKVCALLAGGGYAEYAVVPHEQCLSVPTGMDTVHAAALPETFFTVWTNLFDRADLKKGESILIHGAASGIGTTAIQIAHAFGAKVFGTVGSDQKIAPCKKLGAAYVINYRTQDFVSEIARLTKDRGVDVVLDMVGGDYIVRNLKCLAPHGRHVSIAMQKGRMAEIDLFQVMSKRLILTGSTLRPQTVAAKGAIAKALKKKVWPLLAKKKIKPVIDKVFPLSQAQQAHDYLEAGKHVGKIVLKINS